MGKNGSRKAVKYAKLGQEKKEFKATTTQSGISFFFTSDLMLNIILTSIQELLGIPEFVGYIFVVIVGACIAAF